MDASVNLQRDAPDMRMRKASPTLQAPPIVKSEKETSSGLGQ